MGLPVTGSFTGTGRSASFSFDGYGKFSVSLSGTFVATVRLERSVDGGSNWIPVSRDSSGTNAAYTSGVNFLIENVESCIYSWNCTAYTSGTINYRLA